jgi:hypothetical protein
MITTYISTFQVQLEEVQLSFSKFYKYNILKYFFKLKGSQRLFRKVILKTSHNRIFYLEP